MAYFKLLSRGNSSIRGIAHHSGKISVLNCTGYNMEYCSSSTTNSAMGIAHHSGKISALNCTGYNMQYSSSPTTNSALGIANHFAKNSVLKPAGYNMQYCSIGTGIGTLNRLRARHFCTEAEATDGSSDFLLFLRSLFCEEFDALYKLLASFSLNVGKKYDNSLDVLEKLLEKSHLPDSARKKILSRYKELLSDFALQLVKNAENRALKNVVDFLTSGMGINPCNQSSLDSLMEKDLVISASIRPRPRLPTHVDLQVPTVSKVSKVALDPRIEFYLSKYDWTPFCHMDIKGRFHILCITLGSFPKHHIELLSNIAYFAGDQGYDIVVLLVCLANEANPVFLKDMVEGKHPNMIALTGPTKSVKELCYSFYYASNLFILSHKRSTAIYLLSPAGVLIKAFKLDDPWLKLDLMAAIRMFV